MPTATVIAGNTRVLAREIDFSPAGPVVVTFASGPNVGTVKLRRFARTPGTNTFVRQGSDCELVVAAGSVTTITTTLTPLKGEFLGFYAPAGVSSQQGFTNTPGEAGQYIGVGNATSFSDTATSLTPPAVRFDIPRDAGEALSALESRLEELAHAALVRTVIGPSEVTPLLTPGITANTRVHTVPIAKQPLTTLKATIAGGSAGGSAALKRFTKAGGTFTQVGEDIPVMVPPSAIVTVDTGVIPQVGEYLGCYASADCIAVHDAGDWTRTWYAGVVGVNGRTFTDAVPFSGSSLQIRFEFGTSMADEIASLRAQLDNATGSNGVITEPIAISAANQIELTAGGWNGWWAYGQSLSIGSQGQPALSTTQPFANLTFADGVKASSATNTGPLIEDNNSYGAVPGSQHGETSCSSGAGYAVRLAAINRGVPPESLVFFRATGGQGGLTIAELSKGGEYFSNLMGQISAAKALSGTKPFVVSAVDFLHGESNANSTESSYRAALEQLHADIEEGIQAITGQTSRVHFLMYQVGNQGSGHAGGAYRAQLHASNDSEVIHCVLPTYHIGRAADGIHMTNVQYIRLGHYLGRAFEELSQGRKPESLRAISATVDGTTSYIRFRVPRLPLVIDTDEMPLTPDYGIRITDDTGDLVLSDIAVMDDGQTLRVTLNRAVGANLKCRIGADHLAPGLGTMNGAASTNLRDSTIDAYMQGTTIVPLWHAAMADVLDMIVVG